MVNNPNVDPLDKRLKRGREVVALLPKAEQDNFLCEIFRRLFDGEKVTEIASYMFEKYKDSLSSRLTKETFRQRIYDLAPLAAHRNIVRYCPPLQQDMEANLREKYEIPDHKVVQVVACTVGLDPQGEVARRAAETMLDLIRLVGERKGPEESTHLGFSSGTTTRAVADSLAKLIKGDLTIPNLTLHAVNSGFVIRDPSTSAISFFGHFNDDVKKRLRKNAISFVGLFCTPMVEVTQYNHVKSLPGVKEAFDEKDKIEIVVSSFGDAQDDGNHLRQAIESMPQGSLDYLKDKGMVGDLSYRPYSDEGPIIEPEYHSVDNMPERKVSRAVSIFELDELQEHANTSGKYSLLVAAPRVREGERDSKVLTKWRALKPLLKSPKLDIWTHLIVDIQTAQDLIDNADKGFTSST